MLRSRAVVFSALRRSLLQSCSYATSVPEKAIGLELQGTIGFIGVGNMGGPMAANLLKSGLPVLVFDRNPAAVEKLLQLGATAAASPQEIGSTPGVTAVISMLPSTEHVADAYEGAMAVEMAGLSEALALGASMGLDPARLSAVMNSSTARCWASECYNPVPGVLPDAPAARGYTGGFSAALMAKDLRIAMQLAGAAKQPLHMGEKAALLYRQVLDATEVPKDFGAIYKYVYHGADSHSSSSSSDGSSNGGGSKS